MTLSPLTYQLVVRIAQGLVEAGSVDAALEALACTLFETLKTRVVVFRGRHAAWQAVAVAPSGILEHQWEAAAARIVTSAPAVQRIDDIELGTLTVVPLEHSGSVDAVVVLENDWMAFQEPLRALASLGAVALQSVRHRGEKERVERRLVGGYAMARRLSRLGSVEHVAQRVVDEVARLLQADRVSMALYKKSEDALRIIATAGYPHDEVAEVRVPPGAWVIGHVFASRRPLFVSDVRLMQDMSQRPGQYRTFAFAAVPLLAGRETVGVLTVTDKRDGTPFDRQDETMLRGLSVTAALSIVAARSESDAAQLAYAATTDAQTGLLNRPSLDIRLHQEVERSKREGTSIAVLMADIDNFKQINDTYGHPAGDAVLRVAGNVIRSAVRVFDVCARYGGDEFAILMPNCDRESAVTCAERIRARLADHHEVTESGQPVPPLTVSIGVAVLAPDEQPHDLIVRVDRCLYQAKADGKNAVRSHSGSVQPWPAAPTPAPPPPRPIPIAADKMYPITVEGSPRLPYVLVVDENEDRVGLFLQAVRPFQYGLLIARSGAQAAGLIGNFGPPVLLIVDLMIQSADAFAAVDAVADRDRGATAIVAWATTREVREYAASRIGRFGARVISSTAAPHTLAAAIERALLRQAAPESATTGDDEAAGEMTRLMLDLAQRVRRVCGVPGIGIYLREPRGTRYRASFSWSSDDPVPQSTTHLPAVFDRVRDSGTTIVHADIGNAVRGTTVDAIRGVAGVPIWSDAAVAGAICVFDVNPLTLSGAEVKALEDIGARFLSTAHAERGPADPLTLLATVTPDDRVENRIAAARTGDPLVPTVMDWPPALLERSGGEFAVARELSRSRREGRQLSVVLFNLSPSGPRTAPPDEQPPRLEEVAETLLKAVRQSDLPIRWSVSELLVVLPGLAGPEARVVAERVRAALSAGTKHRIAVSGGVAEIAQDERFLDVVDRARQKVSAAVSRGHNRVV